MKNEQNQTVVENKERKTKSLYFKFIGLGLGIIAGILLAKLLARKGGEPDVAKIEPIDLRPE